MGRSARLLEVELDDDALIGIVLPHQLRSGLRTSILLES
jgi:hypothetical protein